MRQDQHLRGNGHQEELLRAAPPRRPRFRRANAENPLAVIPGIRRPRPRLRRENAENPIIFPNVRRVLFPDQALAQAPAQALDQPVGPGQVGVGFFAHNAMQVDEEAPFQERFRLE